MHKLNRKGYLTVEVILASVVAFLIAFFLFDITIKLVDTTDSAYMDAEFITDKALIIKNIKNEIEKDIQEKGGIRQINKCSIDSNSCYEINFCNSFDQSDDRILNIYNDQIIYMGGGQSEEIFYSRDLNNNLKNFSLSSSGINDTNLNYIFFKLSGENIFSDSNYDINIIINNNNSKTC